MTAPRPRRRSRIRVAVVVAAIVTVIAAPAAWAIFSAGGFSVTATDTAGVLPTPTISGTSSSSTVTLTLGSSGGNVTPLSYTLSASPTGGTGSGGTCTSTFTPPLPASCTYTGVANGTYTYTLTAVYNGWSHAATSSAVTVSAGGHIVGISSPYQATNSANNVVLNYPPGTASGDLVMVVIVNGANQNSTAPAGWTQIANPSGGAGCSKGQFEFQAFWHVSAGETSVTMSNVQTNSGGVSAWVVTYSGIPSPAVNGTIASGQSAAASTFTPPSYTTTAANATVISMAAVCAANTLSLSVANGFSLDVSTTNTPPGGQGGGLGLASRGVPTAGAVTLPTWSQTGTAALWAYISVAFT